ncbi:hypothetical protein BG842_05815 [Haladaptatus sp. W1]|uniref:DUF5694 domain-containing protein n=1 Tax=Haladaptatus sp. W1 TaxID=1897478 RepID=UPI00084995BA|nr:DUF5694 domain-containing protein [Haladaptatus sp. W1]ODR80288.1 hypothetical protein BG842_05815 [Haladaptatus sp. W1]
MMNTNEKRIPKGWPEPTPEQVRVMVLGTYHMDNPGLDEVNVDADDVLADHLDHNRVAAIDEYPDEPDSDPFEDRDIDSGRKTELELPEHDAVQRESDDRLSSSTIPEYLDWINQKEERRYNHDSMFDAGIRAADEPFGSPVALAYWYERNIRMVHHLWRAMDSEDDRILLLVGAGHVRVLRHLLTEAPMFCPVSPLPYLPASG